MLTTSEIRQRFLRFFTERGHQLLPSAPLVPENDPTVLFTTAGMHPLVPYLLGREHPQGRRLVSCQKCLRTDDVAEVGDQWHLTFFEMLGNWSLGDYFKKEAINWSWEFITSKEAGLGLDPERLYVTVFAGDEDAARDEESIAIWQALFQAAGLSAAVDRPIEAGGRIFTLDKASNWWPTGGTALGPCGPDTEMHYDSGRGNLTRPNGFPDFESGRLVEIWNDVFMQYQKTESGYQPLTRNNVDTGMGLDRVAALLQEVDSVYLTDQLKPILESLPEVEPASRRIMTDHLRAAAFLIADGVRPGNKERGYVLRRLLRRSILHAQQESSAWLEKPIQTIITAYGAAYPELGNNREEILSVTREEAEKFQKTLAQGKKEIAKLEKLTGKDAFNLYQSYGFPLELSKEYAAQRGIQIDEKEFEKEFEAHQNLSRVAAAGQFKSGLADHSEQVVRYHTATHLLHQALRRILGSQVEQRGSNITTERLRFDFSYPDKLSDRQLKEVEAVVNEQIKAGLSVAKEDMPPERAKQEGAIGLFGHKYGDTVSVYSIGSFSKEICTGPHVKNTSELGQFTITKEEAVSAGVRRIRAVLS